MNRVLAETPMACATGTALAPRRITGRLTPSFRSNCSEWARKTVQNGIKTRQMLVWNPFDNKKYETFSYLPPLEDAEIAKQVNYITANGWIPTIEFADTDEAIPQDISNVRFGSVSSCYYDNRYWTLWKLPMFGCTDPGQVVQEVSNCRKAFPKAFSRLVAFDPIRQVQIASFVVNYPGAKTSGVIPGAEVSGKPVKPVDSYSSSYGSSSLSDSWSYDWNTSSAADTKKDDWSYDWNTSSATDTKKDDWSYDWNTSSAADTKKDDWSYDWNTKEDTSYNGHGKEDTSYSWDTKSYSGSNGYSTGLSRRDLVKEVIDVAKTVRDLELKYDEADVAGLKRTQFERKADLDKLLAEKSRWESMEKAEVQRQMAECQAQIADLQRKIKEVQSMMQNRDAKFSVQIAACEKDLAVANEALRKVQDLERQFNEKNRRLDELTEKLCT